MISEAAGCYCEMTLTKFSPGIANNSESNMFQCRNTPLEYSILSVSCMPVQKILKILMIFEAAGHYCEMTLNNSALGLPTILNPTCSNMVLSLVILYEFSMLSKFTRCTQKPGDPLETVCRGATLKCCC